MTLDPCSRRRFVGYGGAIGLSAVAGACRAPEESARKIVIEDLGEDERRVVEHEGLPVEVRRGDDEVVATVLLCSHQGCRVEWNADARSYDCSCHGGVYGPDGRPRLGPPKRPLKRLPVLRDEGRFIIEL